MSPVVKSGRQTACGGFTLIEMVVAIIVLGLLSASAAVFLRGPIASYFDAERRARLADTGSLAMARLNQELSRAVPNSVTVTPMGAGFTLGFMPRPPGAGSVNYVCAPNAVNPQLGELRRNPGGDLLARGVAACRAADPQSAAYIGSGNRAQVVSLAFVFSQAGDRLNLAHSIRVAP